MFSDNTFDSVVCHNGLVFMLDPVKALKAFLRVLKTGGKASVNFYTDMSFLSYLLPIDSCVLGDELFYNALSKNFI